MSIFTPLVRSVLSRRMMCRAAGPTKLNIGLVGRPLPARCFSLSKSTLLASQRPPQPRLRLGSIAPNFQAETTHGPIDFHEYIGTSWCILFSHPADFTPVCTTELGAFSKLKPEFDKRNVRLIGLSANGLGQHKKWIKDIDEVTGSGLGGEQSSSSFPVIADKTRDVAWLYDMIDEAQILSVETALTIRSVFIIDPHKKIRLVMTYPASTGRNTAEVLRVVDSLQTADRHGIATPVDWSMGQDVIVPPTVSTPDAQKKFGEENVTVIKPYLRYASLKKD